MRLRALSFGLIPALVAGPLVAQEASQLTLEKLFHPQQRVNYLAMPAPQRTWMPDGQLMENRKGELFRLDPSTGKAQSLLQPTAVKEALVKAGAPEAPAKAAAERGPSLWTGTMDAFLITVERDLYWVKRDDLTVRRLSTDGSAKDAVTLSPDAQKIAFLRGNDLYVVELATTKETRLTQGGHETRLNGRLDWVYDEEIYGRGSAKAFWWAPDSRRLAYLSFDVSQEPIHMLLDDRSQPQKQVPLRYPKAGDPNAEVKLGVVDLSGNTVWMENPYPGQETLIVQVGWDPKGRVLAAFQDRIQTWLELRRYENPTGKALIRETSKAWQDRLPLPHFLKDGSFIWESDRTGFRHLYHCDPEGTVRRAITDGPWDVRTFHGVDEKSGRAYFSGTERSAIGLDAYSVALDGKTANAKLTRLTQQPGIHRVLFDPTFSRFQDRWTDATTPARQLLFDLNGKALPLTDEPVTEAFKKLQLGTVKFQQVTTHDGFPMETMLVLPPTFDPTKKYPVFQEIYGGPHAPTVANAFGRFNLWWHFLAQQGYVVWVCDNRSASNKGPASAYTAYKRLGQTELEDQLDGLAWLKQQGWADMNRVAIDGWSYGGFMSAYALTHSKAWKVGIVGAPVTDYRLYDSIYTERYMGLPKDNAAGYDGTSLMKSAKDLEGRMLLFHGTLDDNVHPQNTIQFVDALQKAGKDHELVLLPGSGHGPRTPEQVWFRYWKTWEFLKKNL
ncbi:MAG: DPP IV N-terminal domain-containing protein [Holophaga sp.]|nr:DPP IV N-terminal domain-containing protein [Holophaga sp.]